MAFSSCTTHPSICRPSRPIRMAQGAHPKELSSYPDGYARPALYVGSNYRRASLGGTRAHKRKN